MKASYLDTLKSKFTSSDLFFIGMYIIFSLIALLTVLFFFWRNLL